MRVLLVEDDEPVAESLRRGLKHYSYDVEWVTTGAAALDRTDPYDVVLLDLGLPDTTAWTSARRCGSAAMCRPTRGSRLAIHWSGPVQRTYKGAGRRHTKHGG